jgi:hypothetical protein
VGAKVDAYDKEHPDHFKRLVLDAVMRSYGTALALLRKETSTLERFARREAMKRVISLEVRVTSPVNRKKVKIWQRWD